MNIRNFIFAFFFQILLVSSAFAANDLSVTLKTDPVAEKIIPMHNHPEGRLVHITLTAVDAQGNVVPNSYIKLHIHSPKKNPLFTTDFPWVEDSHLMELEGFAPKGTLEFDYGLPIRGEYRFDLQVGKDSNSLSEKKSTMIKIHEYSVIRNNLIIFIAILFGIGLVSGVVIGLGARKSVIGLFLILGFMGIASNPAFAHGNGDGHSSTSVVPAIAENASSSQMDLNFSMNPGAGRVGSLNELSFNTKDKSGNLIPNTAYDISLWALEDGERVFGTTLFSPNGEVKFNYQFPDGAEHEVRVIAKNNLGNLELKKSFEVQAIHPPFSIRLKTEVILLLVVLLGIIAGFKIASRKKVA